MSNHTHSDKIFAATACLSETELADYCKKRVSKTEQHRLERHLVDCALCAAAVTSFEAAPLALADLPGLRKTVASRTSRYAAKSIIGMGTAFVGIFSVIGIIAVSFVVYYAFSSRDKLPKESAQPEKPTITKIETPAVVQVPEQTEHFIQPGAPVHEVQSQVPAMVPNDTQTKAKIELEPLREITAPEVKPVAPETKPVMEDPEPAGEHVYNSPVVYIRDLKITDFEKYYRSKFTITLKSMTGVPAQFDDEHNRDKHNEADPAERVVTADDVLNEALGYFNQGRFGKCMAGFELLLNHNPNDVNALFYTAVCNVRLELHGRAIPMLDKVLASPNNAFHQEAEWYKAIALSGKGDKAAAKKLMEDIVAKKGFYKKQAAEKLKTM